MGFQAEILFLDDQSRRTVQCTLIGLVGVGWNRRWHHAIHAIRVSLPTSSQRDRRQIFLLISLATSFSFELNSSIHRRQSTMAMKWIRFRLKIDTAFANVSIDQKYIRSIENDARLLTEKMIDRLRTESSWSVIFFSRWPIFSFDLIDARGSWGRDKSLIDYSLKNDVEQVRAQDL